MGCEGAMETQLTETGSKPTVALFVTCLVDLFRPNVGFAAVDLLERAGCDVAVPDAQTCCGQPAHNSGDAANTKAIARQVIDAFEGFDYVAAPSGSCAGMIREHYPDLFADDEEMAGKARDLASRTYELMSFLVDVRGVTDVGAAHSGTVTYHDSCAGLRELGVKQQPRKLLSSVEGLSINEMTGPEICCGFGGTFCIKYPDISNQMASNKTADITATGAGTILAGDLGCLLNIAGKLKREGSPVRARHVAEVLAGRGDGPAIGEEEA
jgi:L-lactate dehydrogenase complex protein LldE